MQSFTVHTGIAAPLPIMNVDTDMIIPKQFLKTVKRTGLGTNLFDEMRFDENGNEIADFILNNEPYKKASILVSGANFGCGSSREHAPWALLDFGIRCVIASSFADIFYNNCFKNGILPIKLAEEQIELLMKEAKAGFEITIDLENQQIKTANEETIDFKIDDFRRHCLLNGLDDVGLTLQKEDKIKAFEDKRANEQPWL
ncbi:MAG: 3-isopropylmalate dehydratase small subunit [Alphaproteobacteria bacterium]|nr:3-isopropylmalate dehydratase small subunit [Alphaproteobacteria bacterium]